MTTPSVEPYEGPLSLGSGSLTAYCNDCHSRFRFRRLEPAFKIPAPLAYCPFCGHSDLATWFDVDQDIWEVLADRYRVTIDAVKMAYSLWLHHLTKFQRFGDFMELLRK